MNWQPITYEPSLPEYENINENERRQHIETSAHHQPCSTGQTLTPSCFEVTKTKKPMRESGVVFSGDPLLVNPTGVSKLTQLTLV